MPQVGSACTHSIISSSSKEGSLAAGRAGASATALGWVLDMAIHTCTSSFALLHTVLAAAGCSLWQSDMQRRTSPACVHYPRR